MAVTKLPQGFYGAIADGAGAHNAIYRGKDLGSSVTSEQWSEISGGTFKDLFIGDYWYINNRIYRIAGFDYWYRFGDTPLSTHHAVIVPDENMLVGDGSTTHWMNAHNTADGAYVGSDFYTGANDNNGKATIQSTIDSAFGAAHILTKKEYLTNAITNGYASAGAWYETKVDVPSEEMIYGTVQYKNAMSGTAVPLNDTVAHSQLPLFRHDHSKICNRSTYWLRDVASQYGFSTVSLTGRSYQYGAGATGIGIRPVFGIRG